MASIESLNPKVVWKYFNEICRIPRPSGHEKEIAKYLINFAKSHKLKSETDKTGNVLITKPASNGYEHKPVVILQSHIDMVCEKNSDVTHNFLTDPIQPYIDGEWVRAKGTTLGADDGIGVAAQLAILSDNNIKHGALECLFTVEEETGLTGAKNLSDNLISGKILINLDSEEEGNIFIGCAGGVDTIINIKCKTKKIPKETVFYKISVTGLKGGHSGDDIEKERGNSIKILNRFLWNASKEFKIRIAAFNGGNLRNAIPREAFASIVVKKKYQEDFLTYLQTYSKTIMEELRETDPGFLLSFQLLHKPDSVLQRKLQNKLLNSLYACPHGVISMNKKMKNLVETSTNLASIKFINKKHIQIATSQRSSVKSKKDDIANMVKSVFSLINAQIEKSGGYPGWEPNLKSEILKLTKSTYKELFNISPVVKAIHAGLECGLILEKYPHLDMVSFGPTIMDAHSPNERINIESVERFWKLLLNVLSRVEG